MNINELRNNITELIINFCNENNCESMEVKIKTIKMLGDLHKRIGGIDIKFKIT